jgi:hypothetical protein
MMIGLVLIHWKKIAEDRFHVETVILRAREERSNQRAKGTVKVREEVSNQRAKGTVRVREKVSNQRAKRHSEGEEVRQ